MPMNLVERCNEQQGGWEKGKIWDIKYILTIGQLGTHSAMYLFIL
jgi:hypothetical protein